MFSKYTDNSKNTDNLYKDMDTIIDNIVNFSNWRIDDKVIKDPYTKQPLNYQMVKCFSENQSVKIKESNLTFNYIKYSFDTVISDQENNPISAERLKTTHGNVVVYSDGNRTQYLMDKARGGNALSILRKINNSGRNKIIEAQAFNFSEDFFIWLLSRFMTNNRVLDEESNLKIIRIIGFKGEGNQSEAVLSGSGNEVMNLLSSISFLIEMDAMTEIEVRVSIGNDTFELRYFSKNSQIDVLVEKYSGEFMMDLEEERIPKVLLKAFIEVIPGMMSAFDEDKTNDDWNANSKREFTLDLVDSIKEKLNIMYPSQELPQVK